MKFIEYLKTFPAVNSTNSTKLLALLISAVTGGLLTIVVAFVLVWDVVVDGKIDTDLVELGIFILCSAGLILGSGVGVKVRNTLEEKIINRCSKKEKKSKSGNDEKADVDA